MTDKSQCRGRKKYSPWFIRLDLDVGLKTELWKKLLFPNRGGSQDPHTVLAPAENKILLLTSDLHLHIQSYIFSLCCSIKILYVFFISLLCHNPGPSHHSRSNHISQYVCRPKKSTDFGPYISLLKGVHFFFTTPRFHFADIWAHVTRS